MRYLLLLILVVFSCSSKKDVLLIQNSDELGSYEIVFKDILVNKDDILKIDIKTQLPELDVAFNRINTINPSTIEIYQINGYQVNSEGNITIPVIGSLKVIGLTTTQVSKKIQGLLVEDGQLVNPIVDVKIVNSYFTILGEVNKPGRYNFLKNNINIFQAIGIGGGLTINGKRKNIKLLRSSEGKLKVSEIDITSSDLFLSENFQIIPGDIIIIEPNNARVKNAGLIGNSGTLLSLLSFILSSIIVISNS